MKQLWLGVAALLALIASGSASRAVPFVFTYTGTLVTFTVPESALYQILAFGAQGGATLGFGPAVPGGRGAEIGGDFSLTGGEALQIAVGGAGAEEQAGGGGGGGSFVVGPANTPLVIAGGGGGSGSFAGVLPAPGGPGLTGPDGGNGLGTNGGANGNGGDGSVGPNGGAGFFSAGGNGFFPFSMATGGGAFPNLMGGSNGGGFGGGGGADLGAGGGGGFSGGGGAERSAAGVGQGGGGGSFDAGTNQILVTDFQVGNGEVVITELAAAVPEPASIALLGAGVTGLAAIRRRRRRYISA